MQVFLPSFFSINIFLLLLNDVERWWFFVLFLWMSFLDKRKHCQVSPRPSPTARHFLFWSCVGPWHLWSGKHWASRGRYFRGLCRCPPGGGLPLPMSEVERPLGGLQRVGIALHRIKSQCTCEHGHSNSFFHGAWVFRGPGCFLCEKVRPLLSPLTRLFELAGLRQPLLRRPAEDE